MLAHPVHQFGPLHAVIIAGPIIDIGGGHQLPADFNAGDNHWAQIGACRINGCAVSARTRPDDNDRGVAICGHEFSYVFESVDFAHRHTVPSGQATCPFTRDI